MFNFRGVYTTNNDRVPPALLGHPWWRCFLHWLTSHQQDLHSQPSVCGVCWLNYVCFQSFFPCLDRYLNDHFVCNIGWLCPNIWHTLLQFIGKFAGDIPWYTPNFKWENDGQLVDAMAGFSQMHFEVIFVHAYVSGGALELGSPCLVFSYDFHSLATRTWDLTWKRWGISFIWFCWNKWGYIRPIFTEFWGSLFSDSSQCPGNQWHNLSSQCSFNNMVRNGENTSYLGKS